MVLHVSGAALQRLKAFIDNSENRGHFGREDAFEASAAYVDRTVAAAETFVRTAAAEARLAAPASILDLGCSIGMKCLALGRVFPQAAVVGLDVEAEAIAAADALARGAGLDNVSYRVGAGEALPFPDAAFDFVVCHTTIEHVRDVDAVIAEIARVLRPGGALHLMAPNYRFPLEPHLGVWCVPELGKRHIAWMAARQNVAGAAAFLDHLQLVTGPWLETALTRNGMTFDDLAAAKLRRLASGEAADVIAFRSAVRAFALARKLGLAGALAGAVAAARLYPSLAYAAWRAKP